MNPNKNSAMIARLLVGIGIRTYLASGSVLHYVKKSRHNLKQSAKKYGNKQLPLQNEKHILPGH